MHCVFATLHNKKQKNMNQKIKHFYITTGMILLIINLSMAQQREIKIWEENVPNSIHTADYQEDYNEKEDRLSKVTNPTLTVFEPENPNGSSVIIFPGGGYQYLAINKEGYKVAKWFNTLDITAFVLKYRLPSDEIMENKSVGPLQDAQESVRYIRRHASKWNLDPNKIGILGYSAGGHLAVSLSTKYDERVYLPQDETSAKPNFALLIYPVVSMTDETTHQGSRNRLLGENPSDGLKQQFSAEKLVNTKTPATFLVHALDDNGVPAENSIDYFLKLRQHQVISEIHLYQNGGHGFGLGNKGTSQFWTEQCENWLRQNQFINEVEHN